MHLCYHIWNPCSDHEQHEGRRPISLPAGHLTSAHTERMLPCPRRKVWDVAAPSLPRAVKLGEAAASFSLHFSVLPNFNVKENVGHFKSIGRQLFLTQRIMGFSTMNCTSSGRINFDFFFSTRLYLHVAIFSLIQNKKCILLTLSSCVAASHELWHHKSKSSCFPGQSRMWFVGVNEQNAISFLGGLGMGGDT